MPTGRFPENGDIVRIAVKGSDVVPYPLERQLLVLQAEVGIAQCGVREKAECTQSVVERDDHHTFLNQA